MKKSVVCATFCACLSIVAPAVAQTQEPFGGSRSPYRFGLPAERVKEMENGIVLTNFAAQAIDKGDYREAETDARQALIADPYSLLGPELLAQALYGQGKYDEAMLLYAKLSEGGNGSAHLPYMMLLLKTDQWEQAVTIYNNAMGFVVASPKSGRTTPSPLGPYDFVRERYPHFDAKSYRPQQMETAIHLMMGLTYNESENFGHHTGHEKALVEYRLALALAPRSDITNYFVGYGLQKVGKEAEAQAIFQKIAATGKGSVQAAAKAALAEAAKLEAWAKLDRQRAANPNAQPAHSVDEMGRMGSQKKSQ